MARRAAHYLPLSGAVRVHLNVDMDTSIKPYTVVEARIRGSELPDEWVLIGNHRDAWVYGGVDPVSGTASMLELTRALGKLKRQGLRPRRTIVACSWDGEEYALTGSTEWGEQFADELSHNLVAYLNVDEAVSGAATTAGAEGLSFDPSAVASLAPMLVEASRDVRAPSGKSLHDAWPATWMRDHKSGRAAADVRRSCRPASAAARTIRCSSIISAVPSSTLDLRATMASTTRTTTTTTGWRTSVIRPSSITGADADLGTHGAAARQRRHPSLRL